MAGSERHISEALAPKLEALGLLVEDVTVLPAGKRRLVRVLVDRIVSLDNVVRAPVSPVTLDEVADATRIVSDELDSSDVMGEQPYVLEVSSPGTDRPLTEARHFARNVGRLVTVTSQDGAKVSGRVTAADADAVTLAVADGKGPSPAGEPTRLDYTSITGAKVQVEFTHGDDADSVGEDV